MNEAELRAQIRGTGSTRAMTRDVSHAIYHGDPILELPQSGERFEGVANFKEWRGQYPAAVALEMRDLRGQGDLWLVEGSISYDGGPWQPAVDISSFGATRWPGKRSTSPSRGDPPEWRAP